MCNRHRQETKKFATYYNKRLYRELILQNSTIRQVHAELNEINNQLYQHITFS